MKKIAEHDEKLKHLNLEGILKKLNQLQEDMNKTKTDIMKLENDKAEKLYVDGQFKRVDNELKQLNDWCLRLEDMIKKLMANTNDQYFAKLSQRMDRLEDLLAKLQKQLEELRTMRSLSNNAIETRESLGDESAFRDIGMRVNGLQ